MNETNQPDLKAVEKIYESVRTLEGGGFYVRRPFPTRELDRFDPFLLLDEGGPMEYCPGEAKGAPDHPHRGFETLTYILEGDMYSRDSSGFSAVLHPGDVEWTTAGSGIVHGSYPTEEALEKGGRVHVFQIWVNLPASKKMIPPQSKGVPASSVPIAKSTDGKVTAKVIAGSAMGVTGPVATTTPSIYVLYALEPGADTTLSIPDGFNALAYVVAGEGAFGSEAKHATYGQMVAFSTFGSNIQIKNDSSNKLEVLVLAGLKLNEPVARYGPFVMNTKEEILEAFNDYHAGKFGEVAA